jgi:hypothetical protein
VPLRPLGDRSDCAQAPLQRLLAWCRHGEVTRWRRGGRTDRTLAAAVPAGIEGELLTLLLDSRVVGFEDSVH